ncbi:MAG: energy transducer TonB [Terracidiphilus sp.]
MAPEREIPTHQPVVRAAKPAPPAPPRAAVEQTWQPPRPKPQSAPQKPDFPAANQRNAEAKLAEALWPEAEQKKRAKSDEGQGSRRSLTVAIGAAVVCVGLGGGGYLVYNMRSHSQPHPQTATETGITNPVETTEPAAAPAGKPDPRNAANGANQAGNAQSASAQQSNQNSSQNAAQDNSDTSAANTQPAPPQNVNMAQFTAQSQIPRGQQQPTAPEPSGNLMMGGSTTAPMIGTSKQEHVQFEPSKPIDVSSAALQLTRRTTPDYPEIARNSHVSGVVSVTITITPQGTVADARATNGPALLRQPAVNAVKNWHFKPYMLNGHPVAVTSNVNVNFAIQ